MIILVSCLPLANATLTNTTLFVALLIFSAPNVIVKVNTKPVGAVSGPVKAQPSLPLPPFPVSLPVPAPAYWLVQSNHPFSPLAVSIPVPEGAIQVLQFL